MEQTRKEIQQIQTRILELLSEHQGSDLIENHEYQQLRERLTELQNLVRRYEVQQIFGYYSYPVQYCRCPIPEVWIDNRQQPPRCLACGRAVHPARLGDEPEAEFDYRREVLTCVMVIAIIALLTYLLLTGGLLTC